MLDFGGGFCGFLHVHNQSLLQWCKCGMNEELSFRFFGVSHPELEETWRDLGFTDNSFHVALA